jgi:hypothetical protein
MSPTQYELSRAKLDAELEAARKAGDVPRMQMSLAALIALFNRCTAGGRSEPTLQTGRPPNACTLALGSMQRLIF